MTPGEYIPDPTEGITQVEKLPAPHILRRTRNVRSYRCPRCGQAAGRYTTDTRTLHDLGDPGTQRPIDLFVTFSRHRCPSCGRCFAVDLSDLARPKCLYTKRVQDLAVRLVCEDGLPYQSASWHLWRDHRVFVPFVTIQNWVEAAGEKKVATLRTTYLDDALTQFSGYLAIDEIYDGTFCILSVVDNRRYNRLAYCVLEHDPTHADVRTFLSDFQKQLDQRGKSVRGITTDGSWLYPAVLEQLWPEVPHQLCVFHVLKEINQAVLHALAQIRKQIRAHIPQRKRGRPRTQDRAMTRRITRQKAYVAELFEHRHLFVRHHLSAAQKKVLGRLCRGHETLRRLRRIMDDVDRRCRMRTALARLAKLRTQVVRFQALRRSLSKLFVPSLEKALVFLDDKLLGATSNAVERSNRRFRKTQQSIYSVRTQRHIQQRLALDMHREQHATRRAQTLRTLHRARSPARWLKNLPLPRDEPQSTHSRR